MYHYVHDISNRLLSFKLMIPFLQNQTYSSKSHFLSKWNPVIPKFIATVGSSFSFIFFIQISSTIQCRILLLFFLHLYYYHYFPSHYTSKLDVCNGLLTYIPLSNHTFAKQEPERAFKNVCQNILTCLFKALLYPPVSLTIKIQIHKSGLQSSNDLFLPSFPTLSCFILSLFTTIFS